MAKEQDPGPVWSGWKCRKRDGALVPFEAAKVRRAVSGCFREVGTPPELAAALSEAAAAAVVAKLTLAGHAVATVEHVQRLVIQWLWASDLFDAAEAYQNYREHHRKKRELQTACVFDRRATFKPFDYPEVVKYKEAIQHSAWLVSEYDFRADVHQFHTALTGPERAAITRTLLAISQVEIGVKEFWGRLGTRFPRPEFSQVGGVFNYSEIVHSDAYAKLLEELGLEAEFAKVPQVPALRARVDYLDRTLRGAAGGSDRDFVKTLTLFSLFIENVSLFSQFAVMKAFAKHRNALDTVDTVVQATQKEELVHALFGAYLINLVRAERPEWFGAAFYAEIADVCRAAVAAEVGILDWIFAEGELAFLPKAALVEFVKDRVNDGMALVGGPNAFEVDRALLAPLQWFVEEIHAQVDGDKFHKRSANYSSRNAPITREDLF